MSLLRWIAPRLCYGLAWFLATYTLLASLTRGSWLAVALAPLLGGIGAFVGMHYYSALRRWHGNDYEPL